MSKVKMKKKCNSHPLSLPCAVLFNNTSVVDDVSFVEDDVNFVEDDVSCVDGDVCVV